jgi:hypothetical protein
VVNRILYILFVLFGGYFFWRNDIPTGLSQLGIALVFDPYDSSISWKERPNWVKVWLIAHLVIIFLLLILLLLGKIGN